MSKINTAAVAQWLNTGVTPSHDEAYAEEDKKNSPRPGDVYRGINQWTIAGGVKSLSERHLKWMSMPEHIRTWYRDFVLSSAPQGVCVDD